MEQHEDCVICRCEEVTRREIEYSVEHGATTVSGVKRRTRAGMGFCQGKTCRMEVARIIAEKTGQHLSEIEPSTYRAPLRPVEIKTLRGGYRDDG